MKILEAQNKVLMEAVEFYLDEAPNSEWVEKYLPESNGDLIYYLSGNKASKAIKKCEEIGNE